MFPSAGSCHPPAGSHRRYSASWPLGSERAQAGLTPELSATVPCLPCVPHSAWTKSSHLVQQEQSDSNQDLQCLGAQPRLPDPTGPPDREVCETICACLPGGRFHLSNKHCGFFCAVTAAKNRSDFPLHLLCWSTVLIPALFSPSLCLLCLAAQYSDSRSSSLFLGDAASCLVFRCSFCLCYFFAFFQLCLRSFLLRSLHRKKFLQEFLPLS